MVGSGAFGTVYKVDKVAIKVINLYADRLSEILESIDLELKTMKVF